MTHVSDPPPGAQDAVASRRAIIEQLISPGQPYELKRIDIGNHSVLAFANAPDTLVELYAENESDETFLVYEDERLTFAEVSRKAHRIACALRFRFGVRKGDRVAIAARNYPEWIIAFQAITSVGAIAVALNALWQAEEMAQALRECGVSVMFADEERLNRFDNIREALPIHRIAIRPINARSGVHDFDRLLKTTEPGQFVADIKADDDAVIFFTSGSTGNAKGAVSTHRAVISALMSWELDILTSLRLAGIPDFPREEQTATLLTVPLFHVSGCHASYLQCYRFQQKLVLMYRWSPQAAMDLIEGERVTMLRAPAAITGDLVRAAATLGRVLPTLKSLGGGGASRASEQVRQISAVFSDAQPSTGWGMTETNAIGTAIAGADYLARPESAGLCSAVLEMRIVDEDGPVQQPGGRGELLVRGTSLFRGYWNRDELNTTVFEDGWFRTGDVAYFDEDGFLFIVDRIKDLIIRGGENIGCGGVESALLAHQHVQEAVAYSVPDERLGEEVGATLYCSAPIDEDELRSFLGQRLPRHEIPRYFDIGVNPLPRTASGKIHKLEIRADFLARMAAASAAG